MRKTAVTVIGLLALATLASADWTPLTAPPSPVDVQAGSHLTWGDGRVWGWFPNPGDEEGYLLSYAPQPNEWTWAEDWPSYYLQNTGMTFQTDEVPSVWMVGIGDGDAYLWQYDVTAEELNEEYFDAFYPDEGLSLVYVPNVSEFSAMYPVPGWLYCLEGVSQNLWRYPIPSTRQDMALDGICPAESAVVADAAPFFLWPRCLTANLYRLKVSTNASFSTLLVDATTTDTTYDVTSKLANGKKYWRVDHRVGLVWTAGPTYVFTLDAGWEAKAPVPDHNVHAGAALAYDNYNDVQTLYALLGNGDKYFYSYDVANDAWTSRTQAPLTDNDGSALAGATDVHLVYAVFGEQSATEKHRWFDPSTGTWASSGQTLPSELGPGASLAYQDSPSRLYLIIGEDNEGAPRNNFYYTTPGDNQESQSPEIQARGGAGVGRSARASVGSHSATIRYMNPTGGHVSIVAHDATGREVTRLFDGDQARGCHELEWRYSDQLGRKISSGTYFVVVTAGGQRTSLKVPVH